MALLLNGVFANSSGKCRDPVWGTGNRFIVHIADYELSKINRDTLPGNETAVGADLSCAPPIYRPTPTLLCILAILLMFIIGPMPRTACQFVHCRGDPLWSPCGVLRN